MHRKKHATAGIALENFAGLICQTLDGSTAGASIEIWFPDEVRGAARERRPMSGLQREANAAPADTLSARAP